VRQRDTTHFELLRTHGHVFSYSDTALLNYLKTTLFKEKQWQQNTELALNAHRLLPAPKSICYYTQPLPSSSENFHKVMLIFLKLANRPTVFIKTVT
jgi:hypothetical protein